MKFRQKTIDTVFQMACLNFGVFILIAILIGGVAESGSVTNGHYYVINHSKFTEVDKWTWWYSYVHSSLSEVFSIGALIFKVFDRFWSKGKQESD